MKFNCKKTGFTLAEILIVLLIVTILTIFSIMAIRPKAITTPLLYRSALEALEIAVYNAWLQAGDEDKVFASKAGTAYSTDLIALCNQLAGSDGYINTTGQGSCDNQELSIPSPTSGEDFTSTNMHFTSTNSMRFYISKELSSVYPLRYVDKDDQPIASRWYVIFVDLDGEKGLNTMRQPSDPNNTADIVAFALVIPEERRPAVIPIGAPTMGLKYMTATVKYTDHDNGNERLSQSMAYKEASVRAYGKQTSKTTNTQVLERIYFEDYFGSSNTLFYVNIPDSFELDDDSKTPFGITNPGCRENLTREAGACEVIVNAYTSTSGKR